MSKTTFKQFDEQYPEFNYETIVMGKSVHMTGEDYVELIKRDVRLQRLVEVLALKQGKLLDIGCGGGTITNCLAYVYPKMHHFGCDISAHAIDVAKKTAPKRAEFSVMSKKKFPYKRNTFDVCICFDVLEHVPDLRLFLAETRRVLKKHGILFFAIPCEGQPWSLTWFLMKLRIGHRLTYKHVGHIHPEFTHTYVRNLFQEYNFNISSVTYSEHFITQCTRFIRFILPKEILELIMGSRAEKYYDSSLVKGNSSTPALDSVMITRIVWLWFGKVFDLVENIETRVFKHVEFSAWKMLIYATK